MGRILTNKRLRRRERVAAQEAESQEIWIREIRAEIYEGFHASFGNITSIQSLIEH